MSRRSVKALRRHQVPAWWRDAKLGIFVHWTTASVPAFAPTGAEIGELLAKRDPTALSFSPYAEWYENSLRFPNSPVSSFHREHYGDRPYGAFVGDFESGCDKWDPSSWAKSFAATGARYVVFVTKHHEGYCLWPTEVENPHRPGHFSQRDLTGELAEAVRAEGMRFGVYYSGGLDSTFNPHPVGSFSDLLLAQPRGDYLDYADAQLRELIDRYAPSVLWGDISWPTDLDRLADLFAYYYDRVPDGVVNDRFAPYSPLMRLAMTKPGRFLLDEAAARSAKADKGIIPPKPPLFDVRTPEYTSFDEVQTTPWECVRGIDKSFGYNRESDESHFLSRRELLWSLVDIVAKGGNLLLNVGPRGIDASIPDAQLARLAWLGELTAALGEAIFETRPWIVPQGNAAGGIEIRYTARGDEVFAFLRSSPGWPAEPDSLLLTAVEAGPATKVRELDGEPIAFEATDEGLVLAIERLPDSEMPRVVVLSHVAARPAG